MNPVLRQMGMSPDESIDAIDAFSALLMVNVAMRLPPARGVSRSMRPLGQQRVALEVHKDVG